MSLLRQLLLSVTVAIIAILVGTLIFSINGARDYLNAQLQGESDNAATSLALSLSQPANQDPALRELLVAALYDSGQFAAIELRDTDQQTLVARNAQAPADGGVPRWFSQLLPLDAPRAVRQVSDGWTQVGELTVVADDSAAKAALWNSSVRVFGWVLLAGVLWLAFVTVLMRWLRRALREEITRQVDTIADGSSAVQGKVNKQIAELLPSTQVIASARERVQAGKDEAEARIESLTVELNHDAVTGLPNRRYFMNELRRALQDNGATGNDDDAAGGYLLVCRQRDLAGMAANMPREQVDSWLLGVGDRLKQVCEAFPEISVHVGRLNGSDFAVLIPATSGPEAMSIAQAIRHALLDTRIATESGKLCRWAIAMTDFVAGGKLPVVVSRLDTALMAAESAGHDEVEVLLRGQVSQMSAQQVLGEAAWRTLLTKALRENSLGLSTQLANYGPKRPKLDRYEASLTLSDADYNEGRPLSGFLFMPAAVRLGMSADLDRRAIQLAITWLEENAGELVLRVSVPSLLKPGFTGAFEAAVAHSDPAQSTTSAPRQDLRRLIIELDAYGLAAYPTEMQNFCRIAQMAGIRVGLRGIAQQLDVVAQLQSLPLTYIKLGGGFMTNLEVSQGALSLLNAVIHTAMALRIKVLVDETPGEVAALMLNDHGALLRQ